MQKRNLIIGAILLIVSSVGVTLLSRHNIAEAWALATTKRAEGYTALSFINTGDLPTYSPAGKEQQMTFQIANHESVETTYEYTALLSTDNTANVLEKGIVTLSSDEEKNIDLAYTLPDPGMTARIIVQLSNRTEYITFETKS